MKTATKPKTAKLPSRESFKLIECDTPNMSWSNSVCAATHHKVGIPSELHKLLLDGRKNTASPLLANGNAPQRSFLSFRASLKALWFLAYRSQEISGRKFSCEDAVGYRGRPCAFFVGFWDDGSECWAECTENKVNGPFWVQFTLEVINAK